MDKSPYVNEWQYITQEFNITETAGQGCFGTVVKGQHKITGQLCAIKQIKNIFNSPYHCKMILREVEIMRKLSEMPNNFFTTKLFDIVIPVTSESDLCTFNSIFLIMDYVYLDLEKLFQSKNATLTEDHVVTLLYNLLCGINFLHSAGVMHRDLKPDNILITDECGVKICDFGFARPYNLFEEVCLGSKDFVETVLDPAAGRIKEEDDNSLKRLLTPNMSAQLYRAPEIILEEPEYSQKMDQWSMGCIVAEILKFSQGKRSKGPMDNSLCLFELKEKSIKNEVTAIYVDYDLDAKKLSKSKKQLERIISIVGPLCPNDLSFVTDKRMKEFCQNIQLNKKSISKRFAKSNENLKEILINLLKFNPYQRWSAADCLKNKIFDQFRYLKLEQTAPHIIIVKAEDPNLDLSTENKCRQAMINEIQTFKENKYRLQNRA